ncbi:sensor histidine kinase N-terminal domain-containing protein [Rhodanobacter sp. B2A1Ga4]|uniref:ATP-binding protein n=1 Tax=Rhodanobacter sp. B2A1Ga4 TaxID=2778647 RepID=UPI001B3867BC|nr:ATP-binding protein [Rhodanobacter sp. B2A1Ga4]MBQ4856249.1 sensor histidine kinase N-terminal domain-containing protein [Rhodanobacter sp. B2A1Ga4]
MIRPSLNRRLVLRLLAGIVLVWCAAAGWLAWRSLHEVDEIFDQMLVRTAASVFAVMPATPVQGGTARLPDRHALDSDATAQRPAITVRNASGQLLIRSTELPALSFDPGDAHFHSVTYGQRRWRVFQRWDAQRQYWIQVGAPLDERDELMRKLLAPALLSLLALLVLVPPMVFAGLRSGLKPLRRLTRQLSADTHAAGASLTDARVPVELAPFTEAIDRLVARLQRSLEHERRFTADAAHELRHPLAALRLELDLAGRGDDAVARARHLQRAQEALDRMQRLVAQLLMLARVEKLAELDDAGPLRLVSVVEAALRDASERAAARSIELSLDHDGNDFVLGSRSLLGILVQNLLDNALRHAPDHGQVNVRVGGRNEQVTLEVNDNGSGFAAADVARLGERFHRPEGSVGEGSGLGLSIAQAIAKLHHGELAFGRSAQGGAQVSFSLPRVATDAAHAPGYV